uniref:Uncharacterized protein n=1 Tax=viral metagenome TaxID=1070528 RepID=A0A6M3IIS1_9ZZZZ
MSRLNRIIILPEVTRVRPGKSVLRARKKILDSYRKSPTEKEAPFENIEVVFGEQKYKNMTPKDFVLTSLFFSYPGKYSSPESVVECFNNCLELGLSYCQMVYNSSYLLNKMRVSKGSLTYLIRKLNKHKIKKIPRSWETSVLMFFDFVLSMEGLWAFRERKMRKISEKSVFMD